MEISREHEIHFRYDNFNIIYNQEDDLWYAQHHDEDKFSDIQIINKKDLPISLFNDFELNIKELIELENYLTNIIDI